jgi:diguanylate cyclase (GGDEF)-like protein
MLAAAALLALYVYLAPEGRYLLLVGWFVALLFLTGVAGFTDIVVLGVVMASLYMGAIGLRHAEGYAFDLSLEALHAVVFLAIHVYAGFVFRRIRHQRREMRQLREKLASQALTDGLTGLPNRRYFEEYLEAELDRLNRYGGSCCVVMMDVDDFKNYNDTLGHLAGDQILRELADVFREEVRLSDVVARYGGEEFGIIMINTEGPEALEASERLREAIESHAFPDEEIQPSGDLTVSAGVAEYPTDGTTFEEMIQRADEALYAAKREGKNRVLAA